MTEKEKTVLVQIKVPVDLYNALSKYGESLIVPAKAPRAALAILHQFLGVKPKVKKRRSR